MELRLDVLVQGADRPPVGCRIHVQILDTDLQDAPATVLAEAQGTVGGGMSEPLASLAISVRDRGRRPTAWVHVDVDGDGRVSRGDYLTTQSFPLPEGDAARLPVVVRRI